MLKWMMMNDKLILWLHVEMSRTQGGGEDFLRDVWFINFFEQAIQITKMLAHKIKSSSTISNYSFGFF